jgi:sec-independent protein translocase protein TatA
MGIGNLGFPEIILILLVVLLLFGAKRIPEIAGSMGKGIKEFKRSINDATRDVTDAGTPVDRVGAPPPEERAARSEAEREPKRLIQ